MTKSTIIVHVFCFAYVIVWIKLGRVIECKLRVEVCCLASQTKYLILKANRKFLDMERSPSEVNIHISYCVPCGGKAAFDEMALAIQEKVPTATITGAEDHRSGAFEVAINGKNVHSRAQTLAYPDVDQTVKILQCISHGGPIPNTLPQKPINDCTVS